MADHAYIAQNVAEVRAQIAEAQAAGAHAAARVRLLAVSKTIEAERVLACWRQGRPDGLAENKVQELLAKSELLPPDVPWHLIGHLQTNKVKNIIGKVALLHSLDSWRLAEELEKRSAAAGRATACLLEVNAAGEASKFGLAPNEVWDFAQACAKLPHLRLEGLMTVAPAAENPAEVRPYFALMRTLRDEIRQRAEKIGLKQFPMQELSMGMSNDYRIAVEEGATIVRVGSRIFGARSYR